MKKESLAHVAAREVRQTPREAVARQGQPGLGRGFPRTDIRLGKGPASEDDLQQVFDISVAERNFGCRPAVDLPDGVRRYADCLCARAVFFDIARRSGRIVAVSSELAAMGMRRLCIRSARSNFRRPILAIAAKDFGHHGVEDCGERGDREGRKIPRLGEDLAVVVAAAARDREDRVAGRALRRAA